MSHEVCPSISSLISMASILQSLQLSLPPWEHFNHKFSITLSTPLSISSFLSRPFNSNSYFGFIFAFSSNFRILHLCLINLSLSLSAWLCVLLYLFIPHSLCRPTLWMYHALSLSLPFSLSLSLFLSLTLSHSRSLISAPLVLICSHFGSGDATKPDSSVDSVAILDDDVVVRLSPTSFFASTSSSSKSKCHPVHLQPSPRKRALLARKRRKRFFSGFAKKVERQQLLFRRICENLSFCQKVLNFGSKSGTIFCLVLPSNLFLLATRSFTRH